MVLEAGRSKVGMEFWWGLSSWLADRCRCLLAISSQGGERENEAGELELSDLFLVRQRGHPHDLF